MVRKGREIKSKYITVEKGENRYPTDVLKAKEGVEFPSKTTWVAIAAEP